MNRSFLRLAIAALLAFAALPAARAQDPSPDPFLDLIDLGPLEGVAVFHGGRLKSYESYSTEMISFVAGTNKIDGRPHSLTYLDMLFRPERYVFNPTIYVKKKPVRATFVNAMRAEADRIVMNQDLYPGAEAATIEQRRAWLDERLDEFMDKGLISERLLFTEPAQRVMSSLSADLIRTAKSANRIRSALNIKDPRSLVGTLRVIPAQNGTKDTPWYATDELYGASASDRVDLDARTFADIRLAWDSLTVSWQRGNAQGVNDAIARLGEILPGIAPALYPEASRLSWETWYFKSYHMTWVWLVYLLSMVFLLLSVVYKWPFARVLGLSTFSAAFLLHTFAVGLRWYIAGRWPNSNMFEAVTTSVWFGGAVALVLEAYARKSSMRNLFALTAAAAGMTAMMAAHYLPQLDPSINNMMPILHDLWLYIHTNVIIASYALIFMAAVPACIYLVRRFFGGSPDYARVGGAASFLDERTKGGNGSTRARSLGEVCDGATMVLLEFAFVLLWAGIVMGAIWADHSWGRPWGWDPKEVFALNTFVIFLVLIHVRLKSADKGLWTAILAIIGTGVMLFNWIVINFVITGLHSYA